MSNSNKIDLGRRRLLAAGGAAGAAIAAGLVPGIATAAGSSSGTAWKMEADIVVVGSGAAACSAAVTAVDLGDKVILLEKAPIFGGTTRRSGGVAWIPNNFSLREQGIEDSEADCLRYIARYSFPQRYRADSPTLGLEPLEFERLRAFYRNAAPAIDRFQKIGATRLVRFELAGQGPSPDYAPSLPENKVPRGRAVWPDPKLDGGRGAGLVDGMIAWLEKQGATALTDHQVTRILMENGRVVGVEVDHLGERFNVRARKGVIFGTGGYAHNPELVSRYQKIVYGSCASPSATGDLIPMATAVGARMGDLSTAWRTQVVLEEALNNRIIGSAVNIPPGDSMILVNKHGRRVVNEKRNYNDRSEAHLPWDPSEVEFGNQFLFMLFDQRTLDVYGGNYPLPKEAGQSPHVISGATLQELAANIQARLAKLAGKIPAVKLSDRFAENLAATLQRYNGYARAGKDEEFHRGADRAEVEWLAWFSRPKPGLEAEARKMPNPTMHPFSDKGPYHAIILAPGVLDTTGGPEINANGQMMDAYGQPIPGLYGAGNCVASPTRETYLGAGGTIGPAMTWGYIAARTAHGEKA